MVRHLRVLNVKTMVKRRNLSWETRALYTGFSMQLNVYVQSSIKQNDVPDGFIVISLEDVRQLNIYYKKQTEIF